MTSSVKRRWSWLAALLLLATAFGWRACLSTASNRSVHMTGRTMGTLYQVRAVAPNNQRLDEELLGRKIEIRLVEINAALSTYDPESAISRFNRLDAHVPFEAPADFDRVLRLADDVYALTSGAFDPTVAQLVDLWGFGPDGRITEAPDAEALSRAKQAVGWNAVDSPRSAVWIKTRSNVAIDMGAIAKGYGVDALAELLADEGLSDYLVEIGGEVRAQGLNDQGRPWRIGLDRPVRETLPGQNLYAIAHLTNAALATSGDYRNYFQDAEGLYYTHIIDPRTGQPVRRTLSSVTVWADSCARADAWATALYVLGPEQGIPLAERQIGLEALYIVHRPNGEYEEFVTGRFARAVSLSRVDKDRNKAMRE